MKELEEMSRKIELLENRVRRLERKLDTRECWDW